jgi:hypothetical protein
MKKDITQYADCDVFKPGERWQSPRKSHYFVMGSQVGGKATLRTLKSAWASPTPVGTEAIGKLRIVPWDGVVGWVRYAENDADA